MDFNQSLKPSCLLRLFDTYIYLFYYYIYYYFSQIMFIK